jgi:hypothetical protein
VEKGVRPASEVREKMEPSALTGESQVYFGDYRTAAEELGLVTVSDQMLSLAVDREHIASFSAMRRYANTKLRSYPDGQFSKVTQAYFDLSAAVLSGEKNLAGLGPMMTTLTQMQVDSTAMRAWRFWVTFLGFGYLHDMFFIPNAKVFLEDTLHNLKLPKGSMYSFSEFINIISHYAQIVIGSDITMRRLNYGFSNGLRTLHDNETIKLEHVMDSNDIWNLYPLKVHSISSTVTNVTIL